MDQARDLNGQELYRILQRYDPPEFVKTADVQQMCGKGELPNHVYADPVHKLFSCHTAAATWTSTAFFLEKRAELSRLDAQSIDERLRQFAQLHGIVNSTTELRKRAEETPPKGDEHLPDDAFGIVIQHEGVKRRYYPMRNSAEVTKAAEYLEEHRDNMAFDHRRNMAEKILNKATQFGVSLGDRIDLIEKQAGHGTCTASECAELILNRVIATRGPGPAGSFSMLQEEMLKLGQMIAQRPSTIREPGQLCKIASTIDAFDREYNLKDFSPAHPRIEDVLFGITREKMASVVKDYCSCPTGSIYKLADLENIKVQDVRAWFGDDIAEGITSDGLRVDSEKAAAIIPTLPRGDAEMFDQLMDSLSIVPMAKEASHEAVGISRQYMQDLARQFQASQ